MVAIFDKIKEKARAVRAARIEAKKVNNTTKKDFKFFKEKAKKATKFTGKAINGTVKVIKKPAQIINKVDKNIGKFSDNVSAKVKKTPSSIKFILAIIAILIDLFAYGFNRGPAELVPVGLMYLGLSIFNFIISSVGSGGRNTRESLKILGISLLVSVLQITIPYLALKYLALWLPQFVGFIFILVLFFSPWLIYYMFTQKAEGILKLFKTVWLVLLVILLLIFALPSIVESLQGASAGRELSISPGEAYADFKGSFIEQSKDYWDKYTQATKTPDLYNKKGEIDENKDAKLGVFINDVRTIESTIYENENFNLIGTLDVNTVFNPIDVYIYCYIKANHIGSKIEGNVDEPIYSVFGKNKDILQCEFSPVKKGLYSAYFEALFNFETWAYIDYTFVDKDLAMQYYRENRDINLELDINKETVPIYTDGPIKIMMIAADQPTEVDFNKNNLPKIGLTLENNYRKGKISKVNRVIIQTPKLIELKNCTHKEMVELDLDSDIPEKFIGETRDFNYYIFTNEEEKTNVLNGIVCSMEIKEDIYVTEKSINPKIIKTIIIKAEYEYKVESSEEGILVKMDPYDARWEE